MTTTETLIAGRYQMGPCLGAGGMGRVWLARDEVLRRDVAIKELALPFGLPDDEREERRERTLREARAAARLNHPNVVRIFDVQHGHERPWIVMEYVPGRSLLEVIRENGPLPAEHVAGIGLAVLSALDAANRVGVLHRDVKPSNVLIADDGRVVLTDFGSAMIDEGEGALTRTGIILGSPRYIAPERARNGVATPESDLWSLGATLYEAVEGRAPYTRETTLETLVALATEKPDPVKLAGPLKPVLNGLLHKNPQARMRPADVEERLRKIADVQNAVRLRWVPASRPVHLGEVIERDTSPTPRDAYPDQAGAYLDQAPLALPAASPKLAERVITPASVDRGRVATLDRWRPRRRSVVTASAVSAVVIALGAAAFAANGDGGGRAPTAAVVDTPAASAANTPTAAPKTAAVQSNALPAGFQWWNARSGFRVAIPVGWTKLQETKSSILLCAPGAPPLLGVHDWQPSDPDLSAALAREESAAALGSYRRVRMEVSPQQDGAVWEYTFTDPKMGRMHGLDRAIVVSGRAYVIQWRVQADKWDQNLSKLGVVTDSFRPGAAPTAAGNSAALPAGFGWFTSKSGFRVAAPSRWGKIQEDRISVVFCAPGGPPLLGVREWNPSDADLGTALAHEESLARLGNYRRISMQVLAQQQGAVWEYTFTDPKMGRLHGLERAFVVSGRAYLIQWRTPADKWTENLASLGVVTTSFRPAGGS